MDRSHHIGAAVPSQGKYAMLRGVEYGIQRRGIYVLPVQEHDVSWLFDHFKLPEICSMFGYRRNARWHMKKVWREGNLVVGVLHRVADRKRIGFSIFYPPNDAHDFWEFGYAISDPADRNAFSALCCTDVGAHYMFEHLGVEKVGWRMREDNRSDIAVVRRLGYPPQKEQVEEGYKYIYYEVDRAAWDKRRARLDRGEVTHPSGLGDTFITLPDPPYVPKIAKTNGG